MHEVAGDKGEEGDQHEARIGRPAIARHPRQQIVHQVESRGVVAERVKQHERGRDGEEAYFAHPGEAANEPE